MDKSQWYNRGVESAKAGNPQKALDAFEQALDLDSEDARAWNGKGNALLLLNRYGEALNAFERSLDLNPEFSPAWNGKGSALRNLNRSEEALDAFNQRARHLSCLSKDGVCPECNGRMETHVRYAAEGDAMGLDVRVDYECARCNLTTSSSTGLALLDDAEVVSFYRDHGVDLNDVPFWTLDWCVTDEHTGVESEDPWRLRVTIALDGEALIATLDGDLAVVGTERRSTGEAGTDGDPQDARDVGEAGGTEGPDPATASETVTDGGGTGGP